MQKNISDALEVLQTVSYEENPDINANPVHRLKQLLADPFNLNLGDEDILGKIKNAPFAIVLADTFFALCEWNVAARNYHNAIVKCRSESERAYCLLQETRCPAFDIGAGDASDSEIEAAQRNVLATYKRFLTDPTLHNTPWAVPALYRAAVFALGPCNNRKLALEFFEAIPKLSPSSPDAEDALFHIALISFWDKKWAVAKSGFDRLLKHFPKTKYGTAIKEEYFPEIKRRLSPPPKKKPL
ncbi:MAG: hypothetical protein LBR07_04565 [Puniceicoccales bacterium]|nr:hypothetical protein [Puniceicoccales bacterium]